MAKLHVYVTLLRAVFTAKSDSHAAMTAEHFRQQVENVCEEDDTVDTLQTLGYGEYEQPEDVIATLRKARNLLIPLKFDDTHATAQYLDRLAWYMESGQVEVESGTYDWNRMFDITKRVLAGEQPLD